MTRAAVCLESAPILGGVTGVLQYAGPLLLHRLVMFMASGDTATPEPLTTGVSVCLLLGLARCWQSMADHQYAFKAKILGLHLRAVTQAAVYRKSLRISQGAPLHSHRRLCSERLLLVTHAQRMYHHPCVCSRPADSDWEEGATHSH